SGELLIYNSLTNDQHKFKFLKNTDVVVDEDFFKNEHLNQREVEISAEKALKKECFFVDVRELHETPKFELENSIRIPLSQLKNKLNGLDKDYEIILYCQSGIRSLQAVHILKE